MHVHDAAGVTTLNQLAQAGLVIQPSSHIRRGCSPKDSKAPLRSSVKAGNMNK